MFRGTLTDMKSAINMALSGYDMEKESQLRSYVLNNFLFTDDESMLGNDDSFLEKGIIDSTGIMEVIFFLEQEFGISVDDEDMIPENLDSISRIVAFVSRKRELA